MNFFNLFGSEKSINLFDEFGYKTDFHSHLLPGIDDGSPDLEVTLELLKDYVHKGYKKLIMTPHIMGDFYQNTPNTIGMALEDTKKLALENNISLELSAAAEYYIDDSFLKKILSEEELLTFGNKYILVETSYVTSTSIQNEVIFELKTRGFRPIMAHPERYNYLYSSFSKFENLYDRGVMFQINLLSLIGHYSPMAQKMAERLIDAKMVDGLGTDCHSIKHLTGLDKAYRQKYFKKAMNLNLLNFQL